MAYFQGKRVSDQWAVVLTAAQRAGVRFRLNSGQRTLREQQHFYNLYRSGRGNLAAYPNPNAPHIRAGRPDHAVDVDAYAGDGIAALSRWLRKQGATLRLTVAGEPWHGELTAKDLARLAKRLADPLAGYTASEARWIREYDRLKRRGLDLGRRRVLRRVMTAQRRRIWRAAQGPGGWAAHRRRDRYRSLHARTT